MLFKAKLGMLWGEYKESQMGIRRLPDDHDDIGFVDPNQPARF